MNWSTWHCSPGDLHPLDADRGIIRHHTARHGPTEHRAKGIQKITLARRRTRLLVDDLLHVLTGQEHDAIAACRSVVDRLCAVRLGEVLQDIPPGAPGFIRKRSEWPGGEIALDDVIDRARRTPLRGYFDRRRGLTRKRGVVCCYESG
jgi:hypothetical protein